MYIYKRIFSLGTSPGAVRFLFYVFVRERLMCRDMRSYATWGDNRAGAPGDPQCPAWSGAPLPQPTPSLHRHHHQYMSTYIQYYIYLFICTYIYITHTYIAFFSPSRLFAPGQGWPDLTAVNAVMYTQYTYTRTRYTYELYTLYTTTISTTPHMYTGCNSKS